MVNRAVSQVIGFHVGPSGRSHLIEFFPPGSLFPARVFACALAVRLCLQRLGRVYQLHFPLRPFPLPLEWINIGSSPSVEGPDPVPLSSGQYPSPLGPASVRLLSGSGCQFISPEAASTLASSFASLSQDAKMWDTWSLCLLLASALCLSQSTSSVCLCFSPFVCWPRVCRGFDHLAICEGSVKVYVGPVCTLCRTLCLRIPVGDRYLSCNRSSPWQPLGVERGLRQRCMM